MSGDSATTLPSAARPVQEGAYLGQRLPASGEGRELLTSPLLRRRPHVLVGVVAAAHQRAGLAVGEAEGEGRTRGSRRTRRDGPSGRPAGASGVGWRYWPMVRISTPAPRMSREVSRISSGVSPMPEHDAGLHPAGVLPRVAAPRRLGEQAEAAVVTAAGAGEPVEARHGLHVVGEDLRAPRRGRCPGPRARRGSPGSGPRPRTPDCAACTASMTRAKWRAPPSGRSSRSTEVITAWRRPMTSTASATCSGSSGIDAGLRAPGGHGAEAAAAGADVAQDHERRRAVLAPALVDVGAVRLLAHRMQIQLFHQGADPVIRSGSLEPDPQPLRTPFPAGESTSRLNDDRFELESHSYG